MASETFLNFGNKSVGPALPSSVVEHDCIDKNPKLTKRHKQERLIVLLIVTGKKDAVAEDEDQGLPPENPIVGHDDGQSNNDRAIDSAVAC